MSWLNNGHILREDGAKKRLWIVRIGDCAAGKCAPLSLMSMGRRAVLLAQLE
jgi:hypothetical protein